MKLYVGLTNYHILAACVVAIQNKNSEAELLIEGNSTEEPPIVEKIRISEIFTNVYYIDQSYVWNEINKLSSESSDDEIYEKARYATKFWSENFKYFEKISKRYDEINIWDDHFTFGLALAYLKIPYNYYEESPGCNYRRNVFIQLSKQGITNKAFAPLAEFFGLRGSYPYAKSYNYDFSLNSMAHGNKDKNFSIAVELKNIKKNNKKNFEKIKNIFSEKGDLIEYNSSFYDKNNKNVLLITQHFSDTLYKNTSSIRYILSILVDYFGEGMNLLIKNHPSNYFNPIKYWFPDASYLLADAPFELFIADDVVHFDRVLSITSAAPNVLNMSHLELIQFQNENDNDSFVSEKRFLNIHKYYIITQLIERIISKFGKSFEISICNLEERMYQYLQKYHTKIDKPAIVFLNIEEMIKEHFLQEYNFYVIDRFGELYAKDEMLKKSILKWIVELDEKKVIFFVDFKVNQIFLELDIRNLVENLYPLPIDIIDREGTSDLFGYGQPDYPLKNSVDKLQRQVYQDYSNRERQVLYMYTKNAEIVKLVLNDCIERKLQHCGLNIIYDPKKLNYREIVLESMVNQIEEQYLHIQEENKQLKQKLRLKESYITLKEDIEEGKISKEEVIELINVLSGLLIEKAN